MRNMGNDTNLYFEQHVPPPGLDSLRHLRA
jgi:hypothetical protein